VKALDCSSLQQDGIGVKVGDSASYNDSAAQKASDKWKRASISIGKYGSVSS
jgi:hypothetical protein